ncbi:hypothetical protein MRX96_014221 [Rhipicephalus microplus]
MLVAATPKRRTLREIVMAPAGDSAFTVGKGVLAGASAFGLGALCYYGLGMSSEAGAFEKSMVWPEYVRQRVRDTYTYFGGSIVITAASALAVSRHPAMLNLVMRNSWLAIGASFAAMIGTGMVARSLPYREGLGAKQAAWALHCGVMGALVAPPSASWVGP